MEDTGTDTLHQPPAGTDQSKRIEEMETEFSSLQEAVFALRDGNDARTRLEALDGVLARSPADSAVPATG